MIRNLIYYCYPRSAGQKWRRSVDHLLARWPIFTGRKIVTIATDRCCDEPWEVMQAFGRDAYSEIEWIEAENLIDPNRAAFRGMQGGLQEAAHFGKMLQMLETTDPDEITLYCHAKGSTHASDDAPSHKWLDAMAAACLDYPELVDCAMRRGNCAGALRVRVGWNFDGYAGTQHFAGSWYWFRNSRVLELGFRDCPQVFYGTEGFPGMFPFDETVCLFMDNENSGELYQNEHWTKIVGPALEYWRASLAKCGLTPLSKRAAEPARATL